MLKNRIVYSVLFILSLTFIYFYGGKLPYTIFYIVVILPLFSLLYTLIVRFRFKYFQTLDKRFITKGDRVNFVFSIHNEDIFLYPYIKVIFCGDKTIFENQFQTKNFSLAPFKKKEFRFELECVYRGHYEIGVSRIEFTDLLGIFKISFKEIEKKYITVYPRIIGLNRFFFRDSFESDSNSLMSSIREDMTTISEIRKYAYGDSIKKIHWKLSAKTGELMVKNFQCTAQTSTIMLLDISKNSFSAEENTIIEDKLIESLISVINYCLLHWVPIKLVCFSDRLVELNGKNPMDFNDMYTFLSKVAFNGSLELKDILSFYLKDDIGKTNLLIFTSKLNYNLYDEIYKARFSGFETGVVYVSPEGVTGTVSTDTGNILENLPEIGVDAYSIDIKDDIKAVLER